MGKILFLDDSHERHKKFVMNRIGMVIDQAYSYVDACKLLAEADATTYDAVWLDHDLSDKAAAGQPDRDEKTGTHVAEFIAQLPDDKRPQRVIIHSFNAAGASRMQQILRAAGVSVRVMPFSG